MNQIVEFQKKHGLDPDGTIGKNTIAEMLKTFKVNGVQLAHILANVDNETQFTAGRENLNYDAQGLADTWPGRYAVNSKAKIKTPNALALKLQNKPKAIANNCYANRNGNGGESSGDGYFFRGGGGIQTTGRSNYQVLSEYVKDPELMKNPDLVITKYFWESALCFFDTGRLLGKMKYSTPEFVKAVRVAANGGTIGLQNVLERFKYYHNLING